MILKKEEAERKTRSKSVSVQSLGMENFQELEDQRRLIRIKPVSKLTAVSISGIYAKLDPKSESYDPTFPCPVRLGAKAVGWHYGEVIAWIESRPYTRANLAVLDRRAA